MYSPSITAFVHLLGMVGAFPTRITDRAALFQLVSRLQPIDSGNPLIRLGGQRDGGYLVPDDLVGITVCYAAGVGRDSSLEHDCAERGMTVFLADGSVRRPACDHHRFHFVPRFIGCVDDEGTMSLGSWKESTSTTADGDCLLKLDIEGAEYESLLAAPDLLLANCRIIIVEFHQLDHLWSAPFFHLAGRCFEKLLQTHACTHIHPNNEGGVFRYRQLEVTPAMEFTFIRRDRISPTASFRTDFPHPLDRDNTSRSHVSLPACWHR